MQVSDCCDLKRSMTALKTNRKFTTIVIQNEVYELYKQSVSRTGEKQETKKDEQEPINLVLKTRTALLR